MTTDVKNSVVGSAEGAVEVSNTGEEDPGAELGLASVVLSGVVSEVTSEESEDVREVNCSEDEDGGMVVSAELERLEVVTASSVALVDMAWEWVVAVEVSTYRWSWT